VIFISISFKGKKYKVLQETVHIRSKDVEMKTLNLRKKKIDAISNLIGCEKIPDLEALILDDNRITEIENFPNLKNLKYLSLKNNSIIDIKNLERFPNLIELNLAGNEITHISGLYNLPNLKVLYLANNKITGINYLEKLQNLEFLFLDNNQITEIKNLENLTSLTSLSLTGNQINEVKNLNKLHNLRYLFLKNNRITKIIPIHLQYLEILDISDNPLHAYLKSRYSNLNPQEIIKHSIKLEKQFKIGGSHMYAPIDFTNFLEPIPKYEDVLYSTLCNVKEILVDAKSYWKTHLVITKSGIAMSVPHGRGWVGGKFFEWNDIWKMKKKGNSVVLMRNPSRFSSLTLTLSREMESNESFSNRTKWFPDFCILLWEKYRKPEQLMLTEAYYCNICGVENETENKYCYNCGADNAPRLKQIKKLETAEKRSTNPLSSSAIISLDIPWQKTGAKRVQTAQKKAQKRVPQETARIRTARTKLIIGNTHEGKLKWVKKQYFDLKRTIQDIANDLGESMISVKKYLDELEKLDSTE